MPDMPRRGDAITETPAAVHFLHSTGIPTASSTTTSQDLVIHRVHLACAHPDPPPYSGTLTLPKIGGAHAHSKTFPVSFKDVMARLVACAVLVTACVLAGLYIFSDKATDRGFIQGLHWDFIASREKGRSDGEQMLLPSKTSKLPEDQQPFDPLTGMVITNSSNVTATPKGSCLVSRGWASGTRFLSEPTCLTHAVYSVPPISCTASFAATPILAKLPKGKQLQVRWAHLPSGAAPETFFICTCARARGSIIPPWLLWPYVGRCGVLRFVRICRTGPSSSSEIWSTVRQAGATLRANRPAVPIDDPWRR